MKKLEKVFNIFFEKISKLNIMYKIYDLNSEVFNNLTTEEKNNFFNQIKAEYNEQTIKWYLTNLNLYNKFLEYSIIKP